MSDLLNYWRTRIERDLSPFADPGTQLSVEESGHAFHVAWIQRRKSLSASFRVSQRGDGITVEFLGHHYTYRQFYSCEAMADLLGLAKMILQSNRSTLYVDTQAQLDGDFADGTSNRGPATSLVRKLVAEETSGTNLVMVTGEAGAGKTSVLKQVARQTAEDYLSKRCDFLLFYVDAQGRALARFSEALATELQDLRVNLTYHGVSTLVRIGVLVPVIDGFDELIGVGGYDDAFSSISAFIEELDGLGSVLASARSTYYEHEFLSRANRVSSLGAQIWQLRSIAVKAWSDAERDAYVERKSADRPLSREQREGIAQAVRKIFAGENEALGTKPLFVARTVDALLDGADLSGEGALLDRLVSVFLAREQSEKLLGRSGKPLITQVELTALYSEIAEEMWNQGTRELDKSSARELAELALLDSSLSAPEKQVVTERMPSLAFLQRGEASKSISFEHEVFFGYFLARRLVGKILNRSTGVALLLSRSVLPETLADTAAKLITTEGTTSVGVVAGQLCQAAATKSLKQAQVQENAALLIAALLKEAGNAGLAFENLSLHDLIFPGASLRGLTFRQCQLSRIEFRRTELCSAKFYGCKSSDCRFYSVLIDDDTVLDIGGDLGLAAFTGLEVIANSSRVRQIFDPTEIRSELAKRGLPAAQANDEDGSRKVKPEIVDLIERFSRAYQKRNPVCVDEDFLVGIFGNHAWPTIQKLLVSFDLVREESRQAHGPKRTFLRRLVNYQDIPAGLRRDARVPIAVHRFWDAVERKFPL